MADLGTYAENTWCTGCGNFGILRAVKQAVTQLEQQGVDRNQLVISAGIGCHGKIFDYLNLSGVYSIHGRSVATVTGMKIANPSLKPITFVGDGDAYGEGLTHLVFAAKRNMDISVFVHNNGVYALTTGQFTPTTNKGVKTRSSLYGNPEEPLNPLTLMLETGATFIARGYPGKLDHLTDLIVQAVQHKGFSLIDILQPCVTFNNTYDEYNAKVELLNGPVSYSKAVKAARKHDRLPIGVFYQAEKPVYHHELYGDLNPVQDSLSPAERQNIVYQLVYGD